MFCFKIILWAVLVNAAVQAQTLGFKKEKINITLKSSFVYLQGDYYFEDKGPNKFQTYIYYPFVINDSLSYPDSITVFDPGRLKYIPYKKLKEGISFPLNVDPESKNKVQIFYRQKIKYKYFEYILTTTSNWKRPLKRSDFQINIPKSFKDVKLSYKADSLSIYKNYKQYHITKKNFMPEKNLIIKWSGE
jgi:hypothetical protein